MIGSCIGHTAFAAAVLFLCASPKSQHASAVRGNGTDAPPGELSDKPLGGDGGTVPLGKGFTLVAPNPGPDPTPWPTPIDILVPDPRPASTPNVKMADNETKTIKVRQTPTGTPPPARKTPTATPKETLPGGTGAGGTSDKTRLEGPPALPDHPTSGVLTGAAGGTGPGTGGGGGGGTRGGIGTNVALPSAYLDDLQARLQANFLVPKNLHGLCVVEFTIAPDGTLGPAKVLTSTGLPLVDDIAVRAVLATARALPYGAYTPAAEVTATVPFRFGAVAPE